MIDLVWLVPLFPLVGFLTILIGGRKLGEPKAGHVATTMVLLSFAAAVGIFFDLLSRNAVDRSEVVTLFSWVPVGDLKIDMAFLVDPLSSTMLLFVTGIGSLIHLYSVGYMHGDPKFSKFFLYLNLFVLSMTLLVLGSNLLVTFLGWEGVGTCSYFLISFWHTKDANASAGKKAFVTNRIGDFGVMLAMFLAFGAVGSIDYGVMNESALAGTLTQATATGIAALLFLGAVGKSAQLPLYVWLPDAMAGPTPVSALIHAATMVTAGVFLMVRINPVLGAAADWVPTLIAYTGAITALFAATIALAQNDIKKVLAYSTVSQLGYMFLAVGTGAYVAAIFHMITHAFFKALLFLGSGSVIHGMHDEQDMRKMGKLFTLMPITASTFIIGWLAIAGVPPFAGFWSKDEILLFALAESPVLYVIGIVTAILTAFYMTRQVVMTFFGEQRWGSLANAEEHDDTDADHPGVLAQVAGLDLANLVRRFTDQRGNAIDCTIDNLGVEFSNTVEAPAARVAHEPANHVVVVPAVGEQLRLERLGHLFLIHGERAGDADERTRNSDGNQDRLVVVRPRALDDCFTDAPFFGAFAKLDDRVEPVEQFVLRALRDDAE